MRLSPLKCRWHGWCYEVGVNFNRKENYVAARMSSAVQVGNENKDIRAMVLNSYMKSPPHGSKYSPTERS